MPDPVKVLDGFDKQDQANRVVELLVDGELLYAVYDCKGRGTGFLGITDRRLIVRDDGHLKHSKRIVSIPYRQITAVGTGSDYKLLGSSEGTLSVHAGGEEWDFRLKGDGKTRKAYLRIMEHLLTEHI